ncbi:MAG: peptidoglycan DD-metalloendopeptidase family protein [Azospirillum sp.]|nr:peptidoglycan DD-metalloendopeptidase family protein [Azospirillum sp.]
MPITIRAPILLATALLLTASLAARAEPPAFAVPIDCTIGSDCFVQNYVDDDPGPQARDFTCGFLTYDEHRGTDFRLPDLAAMRRGVAVLAAAAGTVVRLRDGVADISIRDDAAKAVAGREAGNAVVIDHGDGWESQYSHLRRGSISVTPGQRVEPGQPLGLVGLSGNTEFPHVHFEVRHDGAFLDPYLGPEPPTHCGGPRQGLWTKAAAATLAYRPSGLIAAGFAAGSAERGQAEDGAYHDTVLEAGTRKLVFWAELFGVHAGDRLVIEIMAPGGRSVRRSLGAVPKTSAIIFLADGMDRPLRGWAIGAWQGRIVLRRGDETLVDSRRTILQKAPG